MSAVARSWNHLNCTLNVVNGARGLFFCNNCANRCALALGPALALALGPASVLGQVLVLALDLGLEQVWSGVPWALG